MKLKAVARRVSAPLIDVVRKNGREVAWSPEFMRLGNLLTLGRWAYEGRKYGAQRSVLLHPLHAPLLTELFPQLREDLFLYRSDVSIRDRRVTPWRGEATTHLPKDSSSLREYVMEELLPGSPLRTVTLEDPHAFVINIRRGDYYSIDEHRLEFGMNIRSYVATVLDNSLTQEGVPSSFHVVSDDVSWCRRHLDGLLSDHAEVTYGGQGDPVSDLGALVHARRLLLPNSTFSYWGGFIGDQLYETREVWVPWLFSRKMDGGSSRNQVSPTWKVCTEIPGGWGPPPAE